MPTSKFLSTQLRSRTWRCLLHRTASWWWRPPVPTPHSQPPRSLSRRFPCSDHVTRRDRASIPRWRPIAVGGQRHLHRMGTPLVPRAKPKRALDPHSSPSVGSHFHRKAERSNAIRTAGRLVNGRCKWQFGSLERVSATLSTATR